MGVPAFYRWLSEKYPKIVQDILEERVHLAPNSSTIRLPFDISKPNPSGLECDNLYIDMNGIIHPCSHPEQGPQPKCEEDMYENVCRYVDRLFRAARPRRMLFLAIDGVAPRAKMNQQRSRRFRSAQEMRENKELEEEIKANLIKAGHKFEGGSSSNAWDSNVITPGTKFMINLAEYVRFYIRKRISTDPAWKNIIVVFSDASIPGEGEHKIMNHIRHQRTLPDYNPNLVHVLHGLDADLIMLALATHEAHFYIMREEVLFGRKGAENAERQREESGFADAQQQFDEAAGVEAMSLLENRTKVLQRVCIPILREYLAIEFADLMKKLQHFKEVSFERLIDDVVFLCFFVGNDFLPHLPSLDIRDGALDFLFNVYKRILPTLGDFITNHGGEVNLSHVDVILAEVGAIEDYVFQMKHENEANQKRRMADMKARKKKLKNGAVPYFNRSGEEPPPKVRGRAARILEKTEDSSEAKDADLLERNKNLSKNRHAPKPKEAAHKKSLEDNNRAAEELKASLMGANGNGSNKTNGDTTVDKTADINMEGVTDENPSKRKADQISTTDDTDEVAVTSENTENSKADNTNGNSESNGNNKTGDKDEESKEQPEPVDSAKLLKEKMKNEGQKKLDAYADNVEDKVRLHEPGWKNRYYTDKCKADDVIHHGGKEHLLRSYVVGLCWVMKYYYDGCPSWKWFYPFHYGPFASDLKNIERFKKDCQFQLGEPFKPVEQLMAVLPEDSSHAIPKASRWFMSDRESPIIDFYPKEVLCDPNGKAMPWLWVVLLPFIDEKRLLENLHPSMKDWTDTERLCNARGLDDGYIYCHVSHKLAASVVPALDAKDRTKKLTIDDCDLFGFFRAPVSNEIYPLDKVSVIHPPSSSTKITLESLDELLTSPIEKNAAVCAAFTEPTKTLHKSVLLPGVMPNAAVLGQGDQHIRRPRLGRGGTIANMGGHRRGQSHQVGYGSMNIGSYERELAMKSGRGNQMQQAGTRQWGAMEPTPKRQRHPNGYQHNQQHHPQQQYPHHHQNRPHMQQQHPHHHHHGGSYNSRPGQGNRHNHPHQYNNGHNNGNNQRNWQPPPGHQNQGNRWQQPPPPPHPSQHPRFQPPPQNQQRRGHNFMNHNQQPHNNGGHSYSRHGQARQNNQPARALSSNVMNSLRSQLASTLNRNRQGGHGKRK